MKKQFELNQKNLSQQLYEHRTKKNLNQYDVAEMVGKKSGTYQRWESSGKHLPDIATLLNVFQVLEFSTTEIIDVLGLPPLTLDEIKAVYRDEDTLKNIKEDKIYSAMRENCPDISDFILAKLLVLLMEEHVKRLKNRNRNS